MRRLLVIAVAVVAGVGLFGGCSSSKSPSSPSTTTSRPAGTAASTTAVAPATTGPKSVVPAVKGGLCEPIGANGVDNTGQALTCQYTAADPTHGHWQ